MAISGGSNVGLRAIPFLASPATDSFGRLRVGTPQTLFDSKMLYDKAPLFWDEATVSGSGITAAHLPDEAAVEFTSTDATAGHLARQTFMRFNYQPGKSQRIFLTGVLNSGGGGTGVTSRIGYFDNSDGIFFQLRDGNFELGLRSSVTGSVVDQIFTEAEFNGDQNPDGAGVALRDLNLDFAKSQIFAISFEWLGVGSVVYSIILDGVERVLHVRHNANLFGNVYMKTPNLPLRYELITTSDSVASKMKQICGTVISEGGTEDTGILRYASTSGTHINANAVNEVYAAIGIRLKSTHLDTTINFISKTILCATADDFEWIVYYNPTVAGSFQYIDETNSAVQIAVGSTENAITGGTKITGGFGNQNDVSDNVLENSIRLGAGIDGTPTEFVLAVRPLSTNADIEASLTWRELL